MTKYLLIVDYQPGAVDTPMDEWKPEEITAHKVVTAGSGAPVVTDGPFAEFKEQLAGYQLVDVESEARAIEIAALISRVPGPGGVPLEQPITVRRVMGQADFDALGG